MVESVYCLSYFFKNRMIINCGGQMICNFIQSNYITKIIDISKKVGYVQYDNMLFRNLGIEM